MPTRWAILTGEYPPQPGGVSDYTQLVARGLAEVGDVVTVFAPTCPTSDRGCVGVNVRSLPGGFGLRGLPILDRAIVQSRPDRVLIQFAPQAFGWKGVNLAFATWVAARACRHAPVWVMFHEVAVPFMNWTVKMVGLALGTRALARAVAGAADRVFVSTPAWARTLRRICPRAPRAEWLPVPCVVGTTADHGLVQVIRARFAPTPPGMLLGHFGTYGQLVTNLLEPTVTHLLRDQPNTRLLLIGRGSDRFREQFIARHPAATPQVAATGALPADQVAPYLRACDLLVQPFPDGVTCRRTSVMSGLANGVPVVTNLGDLSEPFWAGSRAVAVAPTPDPTLVVTVAATLMQLTPEERLAIARRGAELYQSTFSLEHTIRRLRQPRGAR